MFFTEIHNGWEYQDADFEIMLPEDAINKWNRQNVAAALHFYEQWSLSEDAQKPAPENHECFFLRTCLELNQIASDILSTNTVATDKKKTCSKQTLPDRYKKCAEKQLAFDCAAQIILEAMLDNLPFPKLTEVAKQIFKAGFAIDPEKFSKRLSDNPAITALRTQSKERPQSTSGKAYKEWREGLMKTLAVYRVPILQSDNAGLEEPMKKGKSGGAKKKRKMQTRAR